MSPDRSDVTPGLLHITLEIIRLLTGEDYTIVRKTSGESGGCDIDQNPITDPPPHSIIHEKNNKKILELINKMVELLTREVPIRCQDVAVYFSLEESEYVEGHKDQYQDIIMEDQQPLTSQDKGNLTTKKRKRNPENDAKYHISANADKEGLTEKFINPYKGRGVFTLTPIEKGDFVVEFRGELIDVAESQRRQRIYHEAQKVYMYEFQSGGKLWCIDAVREDASLGRLVNDEHRNPNCKIKRIMVDGRPHLCLFAIRDINPGEEITYNYGGSWPWRDKVPEEPAPAAVSCKEEKMDVSCRGDQPPPTPNTERPPSTIHSTQEAKAAAPAAVYCKVEEVDVSYRGDQPPPTPNTERPPSIVHNTQVQTDAEYLLASSEIVPNIIDSSEEDGLSSEGETSETDDSEEEEILRKKDDPVLFELRARLRKIAQDSGDLEVKCFQDDPEWPTLEEIPPSSNHDHPRIGNVSWCKCGNCRPMATRDESVCCREEAALGNYFSSGLGCITQHRELTECRLQEKVLEMNAAFSGKIRPKELITHRNQVIRKAGYRSFSVFAHGVLGPKHRKPIPSCVVNLIRSRYPDPERRRLWSEDYDASYMALEV